MTQISYWGSPGISAWLLQSLIDDPEINIQFVVSQEDKPRSTRGRESEPTPVKSLAIKHGIPVFTPKSLKKNQDELLESIRRYSVDVNVVFAYGKIIPEKFIELPSKGTVNFHASLLPELRGASPIEHALMLGLNQTGWTMQKMVQELDAGDIYYSETTSVDPTDDFLSLAEKLMQQLVSFGSRAIKDFVAGKLSPIPQDQARITHCGKIDASQGEIDWNKSAQELCNLYRGLSARGGIYSLWKGKKCKVFPDLQMPSDALAVSSGTVGSIVKITETHIWIACGQDSVLPVLNIQPEGKKKMPVKDFANGYRIKTGETFS